MKHCQDHNKCEHKQVKYCKACRDIYCVQCKMVWAEPCTQVHYPFTYYPTYYTQTQPYFGNNTTTAQWDVGIRSASVTGNTVYNNTVTNTDSQLDLPNVDACNHAKSY